MPDLSENHLDWWNGFNFFYNGDIDSIGPDALYFGSGNYKVAAAYLSRGAGPIWELGPWTDETAPPKYDISYDYYYAADIEWYFLEPDLGNIDLLKQKIMTDGALTSCINWNEGEYITGFDHYQPPETFPPPNHAIAIIGWDDERVTPAPLPGAWLCKNSYGEAWMDGGYFWVSYYDKHCCRHSQTGVISFHNVDYLPNGHYYNHFYYYDYHGWRRTKTDCDRAFNAFVAPRDQSLGSVSFYTAADSVSYTVIIYDNFESGQLTGELATATGLIEHLGFHTIDLIENVSLSAGDNFYIYLELSSGGQAYDCTAPTDATLGIISSGIPVPSRSAPGQSYFFNGSAWQDLYEIDSTANFCIKGLATELAPLPVYVISVRDGGDGQSLMAVIDPPDPAAINHIMVYCEETASKQRDSLMLNAGESEAVFTGLTESREYQLFAVAVDDFDRHSLAYETAYGIPYSLPTQPQQVEIHTLHNAIRLNWGAVNTELDFDHYGIVRDGNLLPVNVADTFFIDDDLVLGPDYHTYLIMAVDAEGNISDTTGIETVTMRAATLRPGTVLAINRSGSNSTALVDEAVTGELMIEALEGLTYEYLSDSSSSNEERADLMSFVDYSLIVIGCESARQDDIGNDPTFGGILDEISYYLSIGGKVVIFGRWGNIAIDNTTVDTVRYFPGAHDGGYNEYFNIDCRVIPRTYIRAVDVVLESDFIGAHSQSPEYPDLVWDSLASSDHSGTLNNITGIPCPSYPILTGSDYEVIYTYNSSVDSFLTEGKPVAWRSVDGPHEYVFFDIPLSFIDRGTAIAALRQAVGDMGIVLDVDDNENSALLPREFTLSQNYPNPFNPTTVIEFYNPERGSAKVTLEVFNILGQQVRVLLNGPALPGLNRIEWDGCDRSGESVASGIYFYRLKTDHTVMTRKMMLLK